MPYLKKSIFIPLIYNPVDHIQIHSYTNIFCLFFFFAFPFNERNSWEWNWKSTGCVLYFSLLDLVRSLPSGLPTASVCEGHFSHTRYEQYCQSYHVISLMLYCAIWTRDLLGKLPFTTHLGSLIDKLPLQLTFLKEVLLLPCEFVEALCIYKYEFPPFVYFKNSNIHIFVSKFSLWSNLSFKDF